MSALLGSKHASKVGEDYPAEESDQFVTGERDC